MTCCSQPLLFGNSHGDFTAAHQKCYMGHNTGHGGECLRGKWALVRASLKRAQSLVSPFQGTFFWWRPNSFPLCSPAFAQVTVWQCSSNVGCLFVGECKTGQRCPENKTLKAVGQFLSNPEPGGGGGNKNNGGLSSSYPIDDQDWWESEVSAVLLPFEFEFYRGSSFPRGGAAISQLSQSCLTGP